MKLRQIDSLNAAPVGYYWLAIEDDWPPRMVAVIQGPRCKALLHMGLAGTFAPGDGRYRLYGPLTCPPVPGWSKGRGVKK